MSADTLTAELSAPAGEHAAGRRPLRVQVLGRVPYGVALELQARLVEQRRRQQIVDQLLLLEHPHVITLGTSARREHVLLRDAERDLLGIELHPTGRGGDVTYHGPGQLVGYPILDLKPDRCDLHRYVRDLEEVLIRALATCGIPGERQQGRSGVWIGNAKIAAIGVRVSSGWITSHGFALNVSTDLRYFDAIVPCGIRDGTVTSIQQLTGSVPAPQALHAVIARCFAEVFERLLTQES